jgi:hypothetical protein
MDSQGNLGGIPADLNLLFGEAYQAGARVHNNSWGCKPASEDRTECNVYDSRAATADQFVWDHPQMVIVLAGGNDGGDLFPQTAHLETVVLLKPLSQ